MSKRRKTWREKLEDDKGLPRVAAIDGRMSKRWGEGTFVIPAPREVNALMRRVKKGRLTTIDDLRRVLAGQHGATIACPITTGIFAWIAAHAAAEAETEAGLAGKPGRGVTPYWRTLKTGGELNPKYPGGIELLRRRLEAEGHQVEVRGRRYWVRDYERKLAALGGS